jgi:capsid protein
VLKAHPGDNGIWQHGVNDFDRVPAERVIHFFKQRRPGQHRGIPQITSSLPLYAQRRGFRKSVLSAARKVAELGAVTIESESISDSADQPEPFEELELTAGMMTVLPAGWKGRQMQPVQPGTTYKEFDDKLINESARPLSMPFNVAACNSSSYNYSSGRLDHQTYDRMLDVDHLAIETDILDTILGWFLEEAVRIPGYLPQALRNAVATESLTIKWLWRGRDHVDPVKEAEAQARRLKNRTATLTDELAREGKDIESHIETLAREQQLKARFGLSYSDPLTGPQVAAALDVLARYGKGEIAQTAAVELLVAVGIPRNWALGMASKQPTIKTETQGSESDTGVEDSDTKAAAGDTAAIERRQRLGLNGTSNGVHHHA